MARHNVRAIDDLKANLFKRLALHDPQLAHQLSAVKLQWYRVANQAETESNPDNTDVFIYDEIGGSMGVDAEEFARELNDIRTPNITVRINSPGGSLFDGIAIYNTIVQHPSRVLTRVDGVAASAASLIAMAGNEVEMMLGSQLMIHDASAAMSGNAEDMVAMSAFLDRQSANITGIYQRRAGGSRDEWRDRMKAETWYFADEAVEVGLADRVYAPPKEDAPEAEPELVEAVENAFQDIEILMHREFDMSSKDYKYSGRAEAPKPALSKKIDVRSYAEAFATALTRKVN
jgi:ATP-dependent protease ClpP protease subunit